MSDMRFIILGVALVFAGFIILGTLGDGFRAATIEADEFGTCYEYSDERDPVRVDCGDKVAVQTLFFALVAGLVGAGVISLVRGSRGDWDSRVRPEDMAGPGRPDGS